MKATLFVTLKADVLDPQGKAIQRAASSLGYSAVQQVRQGKLFEVTLEARDRITAERLLHELGEKLLSNPVIEDYRIERLDE